MTLLVIEQLLRNLRDRRHSSYDHVADREGVRPRQRRLIPGGDQQTPRPTLDGRTPGFGDR